MSQDSVNESIDKYKDYTYIMYIVCDKTASFYSKIKNCINIPIIIISTVLSITNTTEFNKMDDLYYSEIIRYITIIFNVTIAVLIGILTHFKIIEKEYSFKTHSLNFLKLYNKINAETTKCKTIMIDVDILNIINEYNLLCEYIIFHIPDRVRKQIQKNYSSYKMPLLVIATKKEQKKDKPSMKYFINMMMDKKLVIKSDQFVESSDKPSSDNKVSNSDSDTSAIDLQNIIVDKPYVQNPIYVIPGSQMSTIYSSPSFSGSPFSIIADNDTKLQYSPIRTRVKCKVLPQSDRIRKLRKISHTFAG
jgi:hypothetical protein